MATRKAQGGREARRLCCSKGSAFSQGFPEENKTQEVMPRCSSLRAASLLCSHPFEAGWLVNKLDVTQQSRSRGRI